MRDATRPGPRPDRSSSSDCTWQSYFGALVGLQVFAGAGAHLRERLGKLSMVRAVSRHFLDLAARGPAVRIHV